MPLRTRVRLIIHGVASDRQTLGSLADRRPGRPGPPGCTCPPVVCVCGVIFIRRGSSVASGVCWLFGRWGIFFFYQMCNNAKHVQASSDRPRLRPWRPSNDICNPAAGRVSSSPLAHPGRACALRFEAMQKKKKKRKNKYLKLKKKVKQGHRDRNVAESQEPGLI